MLYLGDQATSVSFRKVVWPAMLPTQPPSLAGGEATASPCRVDKAWTVGCVPEQLHLFPREEGCRGRHEEAAIVTPPSLSQGTLNEI